MGRWFTWKTADKRRWWLSYIAGNNTGDTFQVLFVGDTFIVFWQHMPMRLTVRPVVHIMCNDCDLSILQMVFVSYACCAENIHRF